MTVILVLLKKKQISKLSVEVSQNIMFKHMPEIGTPHLGEFTIGQWLGSLEDNLNTA